MGNAALADAAEVLEDKAGMSALGAGDAVVFPFYLI